MCRRGNLDASGGKHSLTLLCQKIRVFVRRLLPFLQAFAALLVDPKIAGIII